MLSHHSGGLNFFIKSIIIRLEMVKYFEMAVPMVCSLPQGKSLIYGAGYDKIKLRRNAGEQGDLWRLAPGGRGESLFH